MNKERKGTPRYEALKARPGWPVLDDPAAAVRDFIEAAGESFGYAPRDPKAGSFEDKQTLLASKFQKFVLRQSSALRHLCIMLSEFQRPSDYSREGKGALVEVIRERLELTQELEQLLLEALQEAAEER
jgi:hypothetical protein